MRITFAAAALTLMVGVLAGAEAAQRGQAPQPARAVAPIDLTGYWVSVVSEDWRHRMATSRKGDYESLPLNAEGRRIADMWDLAKDNAAGGHLAHERNLHQSKRILLDFSVCQLVGSSAGWL